MPLAKELNHSKGKELQGWATLGAESESDWGHTIIKQDRIAVYVRLPVEKTPLRTAASQQWHSILCSTEGKKEHLQWLSSLAWEESKECEIKSFI